MFASKGIPYYYIIIAKVFLLFLQKCCSIIVYPCVLFFGQQVNQDAASRYLGKFI